jgi:hypothetical protein
LQHNKLTKALFTALSLFEGFCSPALKFRFKPDSSIKFEWDQTFSRTRRIAGFTEQPIPADHIGLYGSLHEGVNRQWGERIRANPWQFVKGLLKLVATVALVAFIIFAASHYAIALKILHVYAAVKGLQIVGRFSLPLLYNLSSSVKVPASRPAAAAV